MSAPETKFPPVGARVTQDFVQGVMTTDEGIVTLLSLNHVLPNGVAIIDAIGAPVAKVA